MLITIGAAVKNLSPLLRREYPYFPWRETTGTRDKIVHHYFEIRKIFSVQKKSGKYFFACEKFLGI